QFLVIAKLILCVFILKFKLVTAAQLTAFDPYPDALFLSTMLAQISQPLQQLIMVAPGMISQCSRSSDSLYTGCRQVKICNAFQIPVRRITGSSTVFLSQLITLPVQSTFLIIS